MTNDVSKSEEIFQYNGRYCRCHTVIVGRRKNTIYLIATLQLNEMKPSYLPIIYRL